MTITVAQTATRLGWWGLVPFAVAPVAVYWFPGRTVAIGSAIAAYAMAILCFLAGAWWGIALLRRKRDILVASNLVVIVACRGWVLLDLQISLLLFAALLLAVAGVERLHPVFRPQPNYYAALRLRLSIVASLSLLVSSLLLRV